MDELKARFRARRSLPTEMNLAKQPYPDFEDSDFEDANEGGQQSDVNVVEMPQRQKQEALSDTPTQGSTPKRKAAAKRKPATPPQKAFPFRQMRDGHQQPYIDELKRLEAQAERINQLLAERKRKKAQAEDAARTADGSPAPVGSASKKKATRSSKQPSRSLQREVSPMPAQDDDTAALEAQAERIKQLLRELESALIEGEPTLSEEAIAPDNASHGNTSQRMQSNAPPQPPLASGVEAFSTGTYRYGANGQPTVANQPPLSLNTDQKAQQEATETAQALRYLASRDGARALVEPSIAAGYPEVRRGRSRTPQSAPGLFSLRRYGAQLRQWLQVPQKSVDKVGDAVLWIVLAAAVRVGARFLLTMVPALTPVFGVLMFAPAVLAVYLVMFVPRTGFVSIYRLFLIMLGLLLGGRL